MNVHPTLRAVLLAAALSTVTAVATARSSNMIELGHQSLDISGSTPLTDKAVHDLIVAGAHMHSWQVVSDKPGVLTLEADSGQHQAVVDVAYDAQGYQITYKSSANLKYEHSESKTSIHPKYNKWVEELNAAIHRAALNSSK